MQDDIEDDRAFDRVVDRQNTVVEQARNVLLYQDLRLMEYAKAQEADLADVGW